MHPNANTWKSIPEFPRVVNGSFITMSNIYTEFAKVGADMQADHHTQTFLPGTSQMIALTLHMYRKNSGQDRKILKGAPVKLLYRELKAIVRSVKAYQKQAAAMQPAIFSDHCICPCSL